MSESSKNTVACIVFMLLSLTFCGTVTAAADENRHNKMECVNCHKTEVSFSKPIEKLEFVKDDIVAVCTTCHSKIINVHHPQRVQITGTVPDYLPIGEGNSITCLTCHDIHSDDTTNHLIRSLSIGNYTSRIDICYECHLDNFKKISPHNSEAEGLSCLVCHRDSPTIRDTKDTVSLVSEDIQKICNFCHIINTGKHPVNVDKTVTIARNLPRSGDGDIMCTTCHDPHGTINTINFLREEYVTGIEFGKYENPHSANEFFTCLKCHVAIPTEEKYEDCKYEEDYIILCFNCHGTDGEDCHPVNIPLDDKMNLPTGFILNQDDLISCVTCHNPDCSDKVQIRYRNLERLQISECPDCHDYSKTSSISPHTGKDDIMTCFFCHKKNRKVEDLGVSQKFICMKCHALRNHPAGKDHIVKPSPSMVLIPEIKLDGKGKIKCSSCHDPHIVEKGTSKLRSFDGISICEACHQM